MTSPHLRLARRAVNASIGLILVWLCIEALFGDAWLSPRAQQFTHLAMLLVLVAAFAARGITITRNRAERESLRRKNETMGRQLEKSSLRYKHLLEAAGDAIFVVDAESHELVEVNSLGTTMLGYTREELASLTGLQLFPLRDQADFISLVRRVNRHGLASLDRIAIKRKDGSRFLGEVNARRIDLGDSRVVQAIVRDITHAWQTGEELKERNRRLALLNSIIARVNESLDLPTVLETTMQETLTAFGPGAGTIHLVEGGGTHLALAVGQNLSARFVEGVNRFTLEEATRCPVISFQRCHAVADLAPNSCPFAVHALREGRKSAIGIPLVAQMRLVGVMHIVPETSWSHRPDDPEFFTAIGHQIGIAIDHARMYTELNRKNADLLHSHQLLEKNSQHLARIQNRLEKNLAMEGNARQELERLDRMKSQFLGMVSHEFRTPLTGILSSVEFLLANRGGVTAEEEEKLLEMIQYGGSRLNEIVTNLLKVVRLEAKSAALTRSALQLATLVEGIREQFSPLLERRNQRIILRDLEDLPYFCGDREHLEEVFTELLINAVKFTPDGGEIVMTAQVTDHRQLAGKVATLRRFNPQFVDRMGTESYLRVEVRDSGIGIAFDEQLKIFDTFYEVGEIRHHSSGKHKFQGKGAGLGLAIVKGMVEAHGGMVWVESPNATGEGSSFFMLLPLEEENRQQQLAFPHAEPVPARTLPRGDAGTFSGSGEPFRRS
jgi:PAS domain S-box-containing protein